MYNLLDARRTHQQIVLIDIRWQDLRPTEMHSISWTEQINLTRGNRACFIYLTAMCEELYLSYVRFVVWLSVTG